MNVIHKIESWGDRHHPRFLDVIRIVLGIFLFLKGLGFMENMPYLRSIIENEADISVSSGLLIALVYYVTFVQMVGGVLIALGTLTRFSALIQLPVVFGAVFFINILQSPFNTDLWSSVVALILLAMFAVIGSGKLSLDNYLANQNN